MRVALVSLESWDEVWRRNQHLTTELVSQGLIEHMTFVEPPRLGVRSEARDVSERIRVVRPPLVVPKRIGGLAVTGWLLRHSTLHEIDVLWVNNAPLGVHCLIHSTPAIYDITDDWREVDVPLRIRRRLVRAENVLARQAHTVVCSEVLRERWQQRYGVGADVVHNGIDVEAWEQAGARALSGPGPHVGYVGTLHEQRLDVELILQVAEHTGVGTVHLVGPDALGATARKRLDTHPKVRLHGPVPSAQVPGWTKAMDVLISPHVITPFTLSLDAIKSYEYLASGRPVVATPTSGFQVLVAPTLTVASSATFVHEVLASVRRPVAASGGSRHAWSARAQEIRGVLGAAQADAPPAQGSGRHVESR